MLALVEAVEGSEHRLQEGLLRLPGLADGEPAVVGMGMQLGPAPALRLQPAVQLFQAGEAEPGLEEAAADHVDLVLDLPLLPAGCRCAGGWLDHVVVGHDQEAPVEHPLLADEHRIHGRLHVVVDAPGRRAAEEGEGPGMGVEHHLLALARIGPHIDRA